MGKSCESTERSKTIKYSLGNQQGHNFKLVRPTKYSTDKKYYIEYTPPNQSRKKFYGTTKAIAELYFSNLKARKTNLKKSEIESELMEVFYSDIADILSSTSETKVLLTSKSPIIDAVDPYYQYKKLTGNVSDESYKTYLYYHKPLTEYLTLNSDLGQTPLRNLTVDFWLTYRQHLSKKYANKTVNLNFTYLTGFYTYLIEKLDIGLRHQIKGKINPLKEEKTKRFNVIDANVVNSYFKILEKEKSRLTNQYINSLLIYEHTCRLPELCRIQLNHINLKEGTVQLSNKKGTSIRYRTVKLSNKCLELIQMQLAKVDATNGEIYLIGHDNTPSLNSTKSGVLSRQMCVFKEKYPQFAGTNLYSLKKTSITNQSRDSNISHYEIMERASHRDLSTTQIYINDAKIIQPYTLKLPELDTLEVED